MRLRVVPIIVLLFSALAHGQEAEEAFLKSASLPTSNEYLLQFLKSRTRDRVPEAELNQLFIDLGNPVLADQAAAKIIAYGPTMVTRLRRAKNDIDQPKLVANATRCLSWIEGKQSLDITLSVLKLLATRNPPKTVETILEFAIYAEEASVLDSISFTLHQLAYANSQANYALLSATTHPHSLIRILAVESLARSNQPKIRAKLLPALQDQQLLVRQRAAIALAKADEIRAVPILVQLLKDAPQKERAPIEEMLTTLAGDTAPRDFPKNDEPATRQKIYDAWDAWWKKVETAEFLNEFRTRTLLVDEVAIAQDLVRKLADGNYRIREKATDTLIKMGPKVLALLRAAVKDTDGEVVRRAEECIAKINTSISKRVPAGIPRLVALRRPANGIDVMLAYVPFADQDESMLNEIRAALTTMALDANQQPDQFLLKSLADPKPEKRALAAEVLMTGVGQAARSEVRQLLTDRNLAVRQAAAVALVSNADSTAVPVLIELLGLLPAGKSWPSQDTLQLLAADTTIPPPATDSETDRKKHRDAWAAWWKENSTKVDITKIMQSPGYLGYTLVVQVQTNSDGRVIEVGRDGKIRWKIDGLKYPVDAIMLPGERILITEWDGNRVTEYDTRGNKYWKKDGLNGRATNAQRLQNGNTFIATTSEILEVDRAGKEVYRFGINVGITAAYRSVNGEVIVLRNDSKVVRYQTNGTEIATFDSKRDSSWTSGLDLLRNGNIVVTQPNPGQKVSEFTSDGKLVHEWSTPNVTTATRLNNGNLLVASHSGQVVIEYDRAGKKLWEYRDEFHSFRARRR